jgi:ubiquinone/menaquinone biosynthesis C-methylase UbiE
MSAETSEPFDDKGLSPPEASRLYDRIGRLQDSQRPIERPALDRLIAAGRFDTATLVFELGCGTGTLARRLLAEHLPPQCRYLGVDVSNRMVELTKSRIAPFGQRAAVLRTDGGLPLLAGDGSADRFIAAYVCDLLPQSYAKEILDEAHRILKTGGIACLTSLTGGSSRVSRLVSRTWRGLWQLAPHLVGGCRPIDLRRLLDPEAWDIEVDMIIESWGVPSQLVVAAAR